VIGGMVATVLFIRSIAEIDLGAIFASIDDRAIGLLESLTTIDVFGSTVDLTSVTRIIAGILEVIPTF
jgi:hypothetical protein